MTWACYLIPSACPRTSSDSLAKPHLAAFLCMDTLSRTTTSLSEVLVKSVLVISRLYTPRIPTCFRLQLEESVYVFDEIPSFASRRAILGYLLFVKIVKFQSAVTSKDSDPHLLHDPIGGQRHLRTRSVTVLLLRSRLCARPEYTE